MTRRRRARQAALIALGSAAIVAPFLIYAWGNVQLVSNGYRIEATEARIAALEQENRALRLERARLSSASRIEERARRIGLVALAPARLVALRDPRFSAPRAAPTPPPPAPSGTPR